MYTVQSLGIHLAFKAAQATYLIGKVDNVPHHYGVIGEDGEGEVGSGVLYSPLGFILLSRLRRPPT